jgi:uncharacterized RDD family membrane protein YckC
MWHTAPATGVERAVPSNLPQRVNPPLAWTGEPPSPLDRPELYEGLLLRRSLAFVTDACLLIAVIVLIWIFNILTFFIFTALVVLISAAPMFLIYDVATVGGAASATLGMRLFGVQVRSWDGARPGYLQAFIASALFWLLVPLTGGLILIVALFSNRRRHAHDLLSGTVVIRTLEGMTPP